MFLTYLLYGLGVLAAVVLLLVIVIALRPAGFRISRSVRIAAPASAVFRHVNDFHLWRAWSPWEEMDPELKRAYSGESSGAGAAYAWVGNPQVGEGGMTITQSRPHEEIDIRLEFVRPFKATNEVFFKFKPEGENTVVTWDMTGRYNFMSKAMGLFMNFDKMVGGQFDQGLAKLKTVVEAERRT